MGSNVLDMKIKRVAKGVEIFAQSEILESFIEGISDPVNDSYDSHPTWGNSVKAYRLKYQLLGVNVSGGWGQSLFITTGIQHNVPNLNFIRTRGLGKGITIIIPGLYTDEQINNWKTGVRDGVITLCKNYLAPKEMELHITMKEVF